MTDVSCPIGCDEEIENHIDYLLSCVLDDEFSHFENLINGGIIPENKCGCTLFHIAAKFRRLQICELFLINCNVKNPANHKGITPFHLVVENDDSTLCSHVEIFEK